MVSLSACPSHKDKKRLAIEKENIKQEKRREKEKSERGRWRHQPNYNTQHVVEARVAMSTNNLMPLEMNKTLIIKALVVENG